MGCNYQLCMYVYMIILFKFEVAILKIMYNKVAVDRGLVGSVLAY